MQITSVYIHIPFCLRKCFYCDFASEPLNGREQQLAGYPRLIQHELEQYKKKLDFSRLRTLYLGGGTPSLLSPTQIGEIINLFPPAAELTLEANPETVNRELLRGWFNVGINRLSLGVQSFHDNLLTAMGRGHSAQNAIDAVSLAREAGFTNINIDLIYGLPEQTMEMWHNDLQQAISLRTEHISLYCLSLQPGTVWGDAAANGELIPADDDLAADQLDLAISLLTTAGFGRYEISNFSRDGYASQHNLAYWRRDNYLGLGAAAASCLLNHRFSNTPSLDVYMDCLNNDRSPVTDEEILNIDQVMGEAIFLGLRLTEGIKIADFTARYGISPLRRFRHQLNKLQNNGLLTIENEVIRLTERGLMLGNQAFAEFV